MGILVYWSGNDEPLKVVLVGTTRTVMLVSTAMEPTGVVTPGITRKLISFAAPGFPTVGRLSV